MVAKEIIGDIIKSHIKENNYSQKEVSLLSGIRTEELSKLISGKLAITLTSSRKISQVFDALKDDALFLYRTYTDIKENADYDRKELAMLEGIEGLALVSSESQINILRNNIAGGSFRNFERFVLNSSISFSKYKNNPRAKLWLLLMYKKYKTQSNNNAFKKSTKKTVYKKVFDLFFQFRIQINKRVSLIKNELYNRGIILENGPYFSESLVKGVSFVKNKARFIFVSDMYKREFRWLVSLVHELVHFYENFKTESKIESYAIGLIKNHIITNGIHDDDFAAFFMAYNNKKMTFLAKDKNEYFSELRRSTKRKVGFGTPEDLMSLLKIA